MQTENEPLPVSLQLPHHSGHHHLMMIQLHIQQTPCHWGLTFCFQCLRIRGWSPLPLCLWLSSLMSICASCLSTSLVSSFKHCLSFSASAFAAATSSWVCLFFFSAVIGALVLWLEQHVLGSGLIWASSFLVCAVVVLFGFLELLTGLQHHLQLLHRLICCLVGCYFFPPSFQLIQRWQGLCPWAQSLYHIEGSCKRCSLWVAWLNRSKDEWGLDEISGCEVAWENWCWSLSDSRGVHGKCSSEFSAACFSIPNHLFGHPSCEISMLYFQHIPFSNNRLLLLLHAAQVFTTVMSSQIIPLLSTRLSLHIHMSVKLHPALQCTSPPSLSGLWTRSHLEFFHSVPSETQWFVQRFLLALWSDSLSLQPCHVMWMATLFPCTLSCHLLFLLMQQRAMHGTHLRIT